MLIASRVSVRIISSLCLIKNGTSLAICNPLLGPIQSTSNAFGGNMKGESNTTYHILISFRVYVLEF
ncbi:uncharacterized protein DS421_6g188850 [Arachis hypogaea]|nr:uncharacterized protein DS421_6g188850 [Arachis hypogaea]